MRLNYNAVRRHSHVTCSQLIYNQSQIMGSCRFEFIGVGIGIYIPQIIAGKFSKKCSVFFIAGVLQNLIAVNIKRHRAHKLRTAIIVGNKTNITGYVVYAGRGYVEGNLNYSVFESRLIHIDAGVVICSVGQGHLALYCNDCCVRITELFLIVCKIDCGCFGCRNVYCGIYCERRRQKRYNHKHYQEC